MEPNVIKDVPIAGKLTHTILKHLNDSNRVPFDHHLSQANLQSKLDCPLTCQSLQLHHRLPNRNRHGQHPNRITPVVTNNHTHTCQVRSLKDCCIKIDLVNVRVRRSPLLYHLRTWRAQLNLSSLKKLLKNSTSLPTNAIHRPDSSVEVNGIAPIPHAPPSYSKNFSFVIILARHKPGQQLSIIHGLNKDRLVKPLQGRPNTSYFLARPYSVNNILRELSI